MLLTVQHGYSACATNLRNTCPPAATALPAAPPLSACARAWPSAQPPPLRTPRKEWIGSVSAVWACLCLVLGAEFLSGAVVLGQRSMSKRNAASLRQAMSCIRAACLLRSCCSFSAASCQRRAETQSTWTRPALLPFSASCFMVLRSAVFFLFSWTFLVLLACQQNVKDEVRLAWARLQGLCSLGLVCRIFFGSCFRGAPRGRQPLLLVLCCFFILGCRALRRTRGKFFAPAADGELLERPCATRPRWPRGTAPERQGRS